MTIVLVMLVSFATLLTAGYACDNVPTMSWKEACLKMPDKENMYQACLDMLKNAPDTAKVTIYALIVARATKLKYEDTMSIMGQMLTNGTMLPVSGRDAIDSCMATYGKARGVMADVMDQLSGCDLTPIKQDYGNALVALTTCESKLWYNSGKLLSVLFDMITANDELTRIAEAMGGLIFRR
ncbi:hypothetical protein EJB05_09852, partial [Eragrostis curvula]